MQPYRIAHQARNDLVNIAKYTCEKWGEEQSERYNAEIFTLINQIAQHPHLGSRVDYILVGLRKRLHAKLQHAIYYRVSADGVPEILRVLHTKQDRKKYFR